MTTTTLVILILLCISLVPFFIMRTCLSKQLKNSEMLKEKLQELLEGRPLSLSLNFFRNLNLSDWRGLLDLIHRTNIELILEKDGSPALVVVNRNHYMSMKGLAILAQDPEALKQLNEDAEKVRQGNLSEFVDLEDINTEKDEEHGHSTEEGEGE